MEERRKKILDEIYQNGKIRVSDLSSELGCSEVTIRNDIKAMDRQGLLKRVHGGALWKQNRENEKYSAETIHINVQQKKIIAKYAYDCIRSNDTIIIDDASGSFYLAEEIRHSDQKRVAVVTNSLLVGNELAGLKHVELYMIGGAVGGHLAATMGEMAAGFISEFHVDKAFIGVHSVNFEVGLTSIATPQMQVKKAIIRSASRVFVLADSTKFETGYLAVICPLKDVYRIITDNSIKQEYLIRARKEGIPLVVADLNNPGLY